MQNGNNCIVICVVRFLCFCIVLLSCHIYVHFRSRCVVPAITFMHELFGTKMIALFRIFGNFCCYMRKNRRALIHLSVEPINFAISVQVVGRWDPLNLRKRNKISLGVTHGTSLSCFDCWRVRFSSFILP